ncbi:N-Acetylglucosaminyltransferase-IV region [Dictyocaulus viviparus]|uniref:N-Acetylglucosaminyltransferase-IV region n=1 Tax=Dictyocaulus viviparus TaxID=29172 RepID=A0A0D8XPE3_DICVI|nr:N-Acetylglucosaminyltransferase-IV region [Dictyocaulus viviparus]
MRVSAMTGSVDSIRQRDTSCHNEASVNNSSIQSIFSGSLLDFLPHLAVVNKTTLEPILFTKRNETRRTVVFCIPVAEREEIYIGKTLSSLFTNLGSSIRSKVLFVVMFAYPDMKKRSFVETRSLIISSFSNEIEEGLLEVAAIPPAWYNFNFDSVTPTFNDSLERTRWRIKQSLDYIYIMTYGSKRADYYLHLEDDIISTFKYALVSFFTVSVNSKKLKPS